VKKKNERKEKRERERETESKKAREKKIVKYRTDVDRFDDDDDVQFPFYSCC
jgi:hypothetical protein